MAQETEKPVLMAGDIFEFEGKQYRVESNDGFMLQAENIDPNDMSVGISWIGTIEEHDYTLIRSAEQERAESNPEREQEHTHGDYENITLHIRYQEPIRLNGFVAETDTITFGSQEELNKYVNGEAAYDVLDNSVMKRDNEILLYAENENGDVVWGTKEEQRETESMTYGGFDYTVIDKWQDDNASYVVGQLEDDDGTWYAAKVTDTTEQYRGEYEYEFSTDKPTRSDVEDMHLNHISEIAVDRHEAEYGADGSRNFPNLNDPSPEEQAEELRQIVAEKSAPVEIDETLPPKDQLKQRLENGVRQVLDSEQFKNWLTTGGKLFYNNYSFRNAMLVWLQKPEASYVMGYENGKILGVM